MAGGGVGDGSQYSGSMAFVYVFNLVVGFGALTLPGVFYKAGYVLGTWFLTILGFVSYITVTFIVESMSIGNAIKFLNLRKTRKYELVNLTDDEENNVVVSNNSSSSNGNSKRKNATVSRAISSDSHYSNHENREEEQFESRLKQDPFELREKLELGDMAKLILGDRGYKCLVAVTAVYLYGDLAIYASATPTTLVSLFPGDLEEVTLPYLFQDPIKLDKDMAYNVWLSLFAIVVVPLSCLNFQKTKHLQLFTCTYRNVAFLCMIVLAMLRFKKHQREVVPVDATGQALNPTVDYPSFDVTAIPKLFGAATYSFMCHHSIPSIIFPVTLKSRRNIVKILFADYFAILCSYLVLCITAFLAFGTWQERICLVKPTTLSCTVQDIYILNFSASVFFGDFLTLLPVFVCFTNYPLIAITTRNNLLIWFNYYMGKLLEALNLGGKPNRQEKQQQQQQEHQQLQQHYSEREDDMESGDVSTPSKKKKKKKPSPPTSSLEKQQHLPRKDSKSEDAIKRRRRSSSFRTTQAPEIKLWHSLIVAVPPIFIAFLIHDVSIIVEFTGSYAGLALEFLFPCWLVVTARNRIKSAMDMRNIHNHYKSPFQSRFWVVAVLVWSLASLSFIILQQLTRMTHELSSTPSSSDGVHLDDPTHLTNPGKDLLVDNNNKNGT